MTKNIALIVMDTARADFVGTTFEGKPVTPEIDRIAESGTKFTNVFSSGPWTLPSHASLFTGQYSYNHGAHAAHKQLDNSISTFVEELKMEGYNTIGATNNAWISSSFGFTKGFDRFFKAWQMIQSESEYGKIGLTTHGKKRWISAAKQTVNNKIISNMANIFYRKFMFDRRIDDGAKRTNEWIFKQLKNQGKNRPFFLFSNYLEPHLEYRPPKENIKKFLPADVSVSMAMEIPQNAWKYITGQIELSSDAFLVLKRLYAASLNYLDNRIGELRDHLKQIGEWDDTIFLIVGDHGENIGHHGLMDHQYCLYDSLLHVPAIAHGGPFVDGEINDDLVQLLDFVPTFLELAEVENPRLNLSQANSVLSNKTRDFVLGEYMAPQPSKTAIEERVGDPHSVIDQYDRGLQSVRTEKYKLIRGSDGLVELYDVQVDPREQDNLVDTESKVIHRLTKILDDELGTFESADGSNTVTIDDSNIKSHLSDLGYLQ